jgi:hypothetical protein
MTRPTEITPAIVDLVPIAPYEAPLWRIELLEPIPHHELPDELEAVERAGYVELDARIEGRDPFSSVIRCEGLEGPHYYLASWGGPDRDDDPPCVCGTHRSEHALCGCPEGFQTAESWARELEGIQHRARYQDDFNGGPTGDDDY